ncbi:MAG: ribonuclease Z [Flavobacteriales bacterium]
MNFEVVFLGTGAAVPVPSRGTTSQFVDIHGHTYLVDAGEGVQLALRKNKRKFQKLKGVFISHMHGDHVLGLPGLLSTMSLLGRREPLPVWGPDALGPWLDATWQAIQAHMSYEVEFKPWGDGVEVLEEGERHRLVCAPAKHRIPTRALRIEEHSLPWKLDGAKAKTAGMPFHVRQALKRGESVLWNEKLQEASAWCKPPIQARAYVYSSDTRPCESVKKLAEGADVLYHDCTFAERDAGRAKDTHHSTAKEAARLASQANVKHLVLGHISTRYREMGELLEEAKAVHGSVEVAKDGMVKKVGAG